ncbi:hypothetical protein CVT24_009688 [Panaeolus cyanescens]|uniref:Queuosine 5'-phosphate N-glycosylase/hydrolase n=1 Tax=Panaeolus cyanescens TaxID=181874 RepID=A0A409Y983_9AGAR|nr:hypothetical protein CVT24_009688 [Panaeolus cyanescens]
MPSFPPKGKFLEAITESSKKLCDASGISIQPQSIERLLRSPAFITSYQRVSKDHGLALPLKFASNMEELNFISIMSLLNFASGYRIPLHLQTGRGAWDNIRALCFGLYISSTDGSDLLSAKGMKSLSVAKIAELMGINLHVEKPHAQIPGVVVGELGGPLYELVKLITQVLNETGGILINSGYPNLGAFVAEALKEAARGQSNNVADVEIILEKLVQAFPAFQDMSEVNGQPIYCFKKALFLIHAIVVRFGSQSPPPFPIPDTTHVPVFSDNVLPSLLIHLGVVDISACQSLSGLFPHAGSSETLETLLAAAPVNTSPTETKKVPAEGPLITENQSFILRAAAIHACELIVQIAHELEVQDDQKWINEITLPDLDMWLWSIAKDRADYRALPRMAAQNTIYF